MIEHAPLIGGSHLQNPLTPPPRLRDETAVVFESSTHIEKVKLGRHRNAELLTGVASLANAALGGGVLAFPFAFKLMGIVAGCVTTAAFMCVMMSTQLILARAAQVTQTSDYGTLVRRVLGPRWGVAGNVALILFLVGALAGYMKAMGDQIVPVLARLLGDSTLTQPFAVISACSLVFIAPLVAFPHVGFLRPASFLAVFACCYTALYIWVKGIDGLAGHATQQVSAFNASPQFFQGLPLVTFAFQGHQAVPTIFSAVKEHGLTGFRWVVLGANILCAMLYVPTGVFGLFLYGQFTQGDILLNFSTDDIWADIGRLAIGVTVVLAYPINHLPMRSSLALILFPHRTMKNFDWVYILLTCCVFLLTLVLAIVIPGLEIVIGLFGATCGSAIVFFIPAALHYSTSARVTTRVGLEVGMIALVGSIVAVAGTTLTVIDGIAKY